MRSRGVARTAFHGRGTHRGPGPLRARATWTLLVGLAALVSCGGEGAGHREPAPEGPRPPSIIFILTDDQAPDSLGVAGNRFVQTPHLDAMAADGAYFRRAYVPTPQCAPSRASILTGRYPHATGVMTNRDARLPPSLQTMSGALKEQGYATGLVGKWHLGDEERPHAGFEDLWVTVAAPGRYTDPDSVEILRSATHTFSARVAERFRVGRVLLAGDAAHVAPRASSGRAVSCRMSWTTSV